MALARDLFVGETLFIFAEKTTETARNCVAVLCRVLARKNLEIFSTKTAKNCVCILDGI